MIVMCCMGATRTMMGSVDDTEARLGVAQRVTHTMERMKIVSMELGLVLWQVIDKRSARRTEYVSVSSAAELQREAERLLATSPDDRAFVSHFVVSGRAFNGYRKCPREFYGSGFDRVDV